MIEESAIVVSCDGEFAEVEAERRSSCGACEAKGVCGTSVLAKAFGRRAVSMRVHNGIQARPGERVVVGLDSAMLNRASLAAYLAPIAALIIGGLFGDYMGSRLGFENAEPVSIFFGLLGLFGALLWLRWFSRRAGGDARYRPVILRRVEARSVPVRWHATSGDFG